MGPARKRATEEERIQAALEKGREVLETARAVPVSKLGVPAVRERVIQKLLEEGYERVGTKLRLPLPRQAQILMDQGAHIPLSSLKKRLGGASAVESKALAQKLCQEGRARLVLRGKQLSLVPGSEAVARREDLRQLSSELKSISDWIKKALANRVGATVLKVDLNEAIAELNDALGSEVGMGRQSKPEDPAAHSSAPVLSSPSMVPLIQALRGAILVARDEDSSLAWVPDVSRALRAMVSEQVLKEALLEGHQTGEWDLRPEGGIGRLSEEDARLCPLGMGNIPMSFVRLKEK